MPGADEKLTALGIVLPPPLKLPPGMVLPFPWVNVRGDRAYISGHGLRNQTARSPGRSAPWARAYR